MSEIRPSDMRVCQRCKLRDTHVDDMEFEMVGIKKPVRKFYHKECFKTHMEIKEFRRIEQEKLDHLTEVIKKIYGLKRVPNTVYPFLQDLRNGNDFFGKRHYNYKKGYDYNLIADTFEYCTSTIEYWNATKDFKGATQAIRYGLAIVCDKIKFVEDRNDRKKREKEVIEARTKNEVYEEFETGYVRPDERRNKEESLADILGDDF